jgi:EsV-like protein
MARNEQASLPIEYPKQPATLEYEARRCEHPGCDKLPAFGYGMPFSRKNVWVCREHREWFEQSTRNAR